MKTRLQQSHRRHPPVPGPYADATLASAIRDTRTPAAEKARKQAERQAFRLLARGELRCDSEQVAEAILEESVDLETLTLERPLYNSWLALATAYDLDPEECPACREPIDCTETESDPGMTSHRTRLFEASCECGAAQGGCEDSAREALINGVVFQ